MKCLCVDCGAEWMEKIDYELSEAESFWYEELGSLPLLCEECK